MIAALEWVMPKYESDVCPVRKQVEHICQQTIRARVLVQLHRAGARGIALVPK